MNLCDIREVKALLSRHGFHFSKSLDKIFSSLTGSPGTLPPPEAETKPAACWRSAPASAV